MVSLSMGILVAMVFVSGPTVILTKAILEMAFNKAKEHLSVTKVAGHTLENGNRAK